MPTKTELIWDGKYDAKGNRVAPLRVALPFQTVETINESAQERQKNLFRSLALQAGESEPWRNRLIWGDKKYVLPSLLPEFAGKVNLIYIDPPFDTGADFSFTATVPDSNPDDDQDDSASFTKEPSLIEQKAYRDTWGRGLDSYLQWFYETVVLLHELLTDQGSIFVHLDDNIGSYAKVILDEVFGSSCYQSEVIWQRTDAHNDARLKFGNIHDTIFWYGKAPRPTYYPEAVRTKLSVSGLAEYSLLELPSGQVVPYAGNEEKKGRRFKLDDATWKGNNPKKKFTWRGATPSLNREWMYTFEDMEAALKSRELFLRNPEKGAARCRKSYLDENKGIYLQDIWTDAGRMKGGSSYRTEKPEPLLERIIKACSNEGDLVLDCFAGSGTTAAVAEKLNRRWIACDLGRFAIHTTRKRLLQIPGVRPFIVQNLGKYERQLWQSGEFSASSASSAVQNLTAENAEKADERHRAYVAFILKLYGATPISGRTWLHGVRAGRMVHVGGVEAPVSVGDVKQMVAEFKKAMGTGKDAPATNGIDVLGWDFAFEINEVARQQAADANIKMAFKRIPRDVMDKRAVDQGDIHFFELAALGVEVKTKKPGAGASGSCVTLTLTDFVIPPDDVPEEVRGSVKHWSQWIDYWSVDWDFKGDTFHNEWQAFRTRKNNKLPLEVMHEYAEAGEYRIVVKVIDILGNDTTKTVKVRVK